MIIKNKALRENHSSIKINIDSIIIMHFLINFGLETKVGLSLGSSQHFSLLY